MYNPCIQISIILLLQYQLCFGLEDGSNSISQTNDQKSREGRTLINQFPFNQGAHLQGGGHHGDHHQDHHGTHHGSHEEHGHHADHSSHAQHGFHNGFPQLHQGFGDAQRLSRQGAATGNEVDEIGPLDIGTIAQAGERCVEKVMMIEETKYDDSIECHHSYDERCHTTYTTDFEPQQVEKCDENFVKECHIEYEDKAFDESVEICNERPIRDCQGKEGPIVCETVYETECQTSYHLHEVEEDVPKCETIMMEKCRDVTQGYTTQQECDKWPQQICELEKKKTKKYSPETQCKKIPQQLCGPGACPIIAGPKECRKEMKTIVQEVPKERCSLRAQPFCEFETKLVPVLKPVDNCVDVPKEVCVRMRTNPRKVKKPVIKKWCYVPTEESGLLTTARPTTTTTTEAATESGRSFESTPDTLYGAPPLVTTEPPQLYGAPPPSNHNHGGYGAVPPGTLDTSYTAALPPPRPTTVEKARSGSIENGSKRTLRGRKGKLNNNKNNRSSQNKNNRAAIARLNAKAKRFQRKKAKLNKNKNRKF